MSLEFADPLQESDVVLAKYHGRWRLGRNPLAQCLDEGRRSVGEQHIRIKAFENGQHVGKGGLCLLDGRVIRDRQFRFGDGPVFRLEFGAKAHYVIKVGIVKIQRVDQT